MHFYTSIARELINKYSPKQGLVPYPLYLRILLKVVKTVFFLPQNVLLMYNRPKKLSGGSLTNEANNVARFFSPIVNHTMSKSSKHLYKYNFFSYIYNHIYIFTQVSLNDK